MLQIPLRPCVFPLRLRARRSGSVTTIVTATIVTATIVAATWSPVAAQLPDRAGLPPAPVDASPLEHALAMNANLLCSGVFVQGREPEVHIAEDLKAFDHFSFEDDFEWTVDRELGTVTLWVARDAADRDPAEAGTGREPGAAAPEMTGGPGAPPVASERLLTRTARHNGDQGCSILPPGWTEPAFEPVDVGRDWTDPKGLPWPTGDRLATEPLPAGVDVDALEAALDFAFDDQGRERPQNTRSLVVVHRGRIVAERHAPGWGPRTPQLSWSQGKSIAAALIGVLVEQGELSVEDAAPVDVWQGEGDPRARITVADLLHMSSGLDFDNWGIGRPYSLSVENSHFRIYFDALDVYEHAVWRQLEHPPGTVWRYRNSDPLTLMRIARAIVEERGESFLGFPWEHLFDRIGMRDVVLETDPFGNFIVTGYDYASARDWARFGLLHLDDGVWEGERILPEGWAEWVATPAPAAPEEQYGGLFWLNRSGGYPSVPEDAYFAAGFMGQTTLVVPSRDLVVVRLGPSAGGFDAYFDEVVRRLLTALP